MGPAAPRLAVVVLSWNARADTLACLQRVVPQLEAGELCVVSDNGSEDGSEVEVRARFPQVRYVQNQTNLGFAGGVNAGIRAALDCAPDWLLVLNNDTEPGPDLLARLRENAAAQPPRVAALQPLLVSTQDPDRIDSAGLELRWFPGARDAEQGLRDAPTAPRCQPIFGACGAAALYRASALERTGLFDAELFVLFEDVDLAFRLRAAGYEARLLRDVGLPHRRGVSASRGARASVARARRRLWVQRNTIALALRYWPTHRLVLALPVLALRALDALWLQRTHGPGTCGPLWRRARRQRRTLRAGLRQHGADRWLGGRDDGPIA